MADTLAINGGQKIRETAFPPWPALDDRDVDAVSAVLRSGGLTQLTAGTVAEFENEFASWHGAKHAIATSSGTTAIHIALAALDIGTGDEVIVPAHTFIASATPVLHQNATPVFADVDEHTFCISPESVEERVTSRTKAIIAVHLNGHPAHLKALQEIAEPRGIALIEDAAQAHGALYRDHKVGTVGAAGCFSFWEDKIMTTGGEGGCVITEDDALAQRMRRVRHHGEGPIEGERAYYHLELGYNYRMTSMQAATGLVQLRQLDDYLEARRRNAAYLTERLGDIAGIDPPFVDEFTVHSYYKYICRLRPEAGIDIADFVRAVAAEGIPISRRYPTPLSEQPVFRDVEAAPCPTADHLANELFTLLVHPTITNSDLDDVVQAIKKVVSALRKLGSE
ncbi:MAG: DegT/DnrJ/EryC1/StrS family aminotransferase [Chloroflexi bacterium]|nr:DegT/DnrJ/EryC1/StrS family aminotransferase [Chloroflexota bacterium]